MNDISQHVRHKALSQLSDAQKMIQEGREELAAATQKIQLAQELIDESARILRETSH